MQAEFINIGLGSPNGKNITSQKGNDVADSSITMNKHSIYEVVSLDAPSNLTYLRLIKKIKK